MSAIAMYRSLHSLISIFCFSILAFATDDSVPAVLNISPACRKDFQKPPGHRVSDAVTVTYDPSAHLATIRHPENMVLVMGQMYAHESRKEFPFENEP